MDHSERGWMYDRLDGRGGINHSFVHGVDLFIRFASSNRGYMSGDKIRCPCNKCLNVNYTDVETTRLHLFQHGFIENYYEWTYQGERYQTSSSNATHANLEHRFETMNPYRRMVLDAARANFDFGGDWSSFNDIPNDNIEDDPSNTYEPSMEEFPNLESQRFYDMLKAADDKLYPGSCHTQLSAVSRMLDIKAEHGLLQRCYNQIMQLFKEALPKDNILIDNYYNTKKLVRSLGLPVLKIDCCKSGCMLYWDDNEHLTLCKFCGTERYKDMRKKRPHKQMYYFPLTPRLRRLYQSDATAAHMRWHHEHDQNEGVMSHPSDSEAWKHFNEKHPFFSDEIRNVRLGLCIDGFQPFGQSGSRYSSWPVIITPYNLPPWMCMKEAYMFLTIIVPGPHNPKQKLDVYLQPLIKELIELWETGVAAYDMHKAKLSATGSSYVDH